MKVIMLIIICFGTNTGLGCQAIWEKTYYPSIKECITASAPVKDYMVNKYPESAGEIHCMTEEVFQDYIEFLEKGGEPTITLPNPDAS